jgi:hypothetical protein
MRHNDFVISIAVLIVSAIMLIGTLFVNAKINESSQQVSHQTNPEHVAKCSLLYIMTGDEAASLTILSLHDGKEEAIRHLEFEVGLITQIETRPDLLKRVVNSYIKSCNIIGEKLPTVFIDQKRHSYKNL